MELKLMNLTLGQKFKKLREQAGATIAETAALLKLSSSTYQKWEEDFIYPVDGQIARLGKLYDLSYDEVLKVGE
jgi:transcriptional regulator with XRE-family HTH domain